MYMLMCCMYLCVHVILKEGIDIVSLIKICLDSYLMCLFMFVACANCSVVCGKWCVVTQVMIFVCDI